MASADVSQQTAGVWVVMSHFNYRKEVSATVYSVHFSAKVAHAWARKICYEHYGEVFDVSNHEDVVCCADIMYGSRNPYQENVYYVRFVKGMTNDLPEDIPEVRLLSEV